MKDQHNSTSWAQLGLMFSDDILGPEKTLSQLNDLPETGDDLLSDPTLPLLGLQDDIIMNDFLFSCGTDFGVPDQLDDNIGEGGKESFNWRSFEYLLPDSAEINGCRQREDDTQSSVGSKESKRPKGAPGRRKTKELKSTTSSAKKRFTQKYISSSKSASALKEELNENCLASNNVSNSDTHLDVLDEKNVLALGFDISALMHDYAMKMPPAQSNVSTSTSSHFIHSDAEFPNSCISVYQSSFALAADVNQPNGVYSIPAPSLTLRSPSSHTVIVHKSPSLAASTFSKPRCGRPKKVEIKDNYSPSFSMPWESDPCTTANDPTLGTCLTWSSADPMMDILDSLHQQWSASPMSLSSFDSRENSSSSPLSSSAPSPIPLRPDNRTDEKIYPCTYPDCHKVYLKSSHLKAHLRRHTGEKPFHCSWPDCGWKFSRSDELARHRRSHSGFKPYKCDTCTKCFSRSDHLAKHKKVHGKQRH